EYFSCPAIFDSEINFLEFDASIFMTKLPLAHPIEYEVARKACEKREVELAHWMPTDLVGQLLCMMYETPISHDVFEFADRLGMSLRS
ncbi:AraC family transcriptional regulator, partial [Burkholderia pseudomallei]